MRRLLVFVVVIIALVYAFFSFNKESTTDQVKNVQAQDDVKVVNTWFPKTSEKYVDIGHPLTAESAILVDFDTGNVIFAKNPQNKHPGASTIKIMTALVALDSSKLSDVFTVSKKAAEVGEDTMGLTEGERVNLEKLLYGLMLPSGNDAAVTIAENVAGSEDKFVLEMNRKAKEIGIKNTRFINASGLDVDGEDQYTSAYDMAILAHFIWEKYPVFRKVSETDHISFEVTDNHKFFDLYNQTNLLTTYPGVKGIKPGFTWEAGYCLVTYAENDGHKLIGVILNSADRRNEMKELLDFGFNKMGVKIQHPALP